MTSLLSGRAAQIAAAALSADPGDAALIGTDAHGTIVFWNERATELYGWEADETFGRNIVDVTPTRGTSDEAATIMEELLSGRSWSGKFLARHRDGAPLLVHVTNLPVRDGNEVIGVIGVSRLD